MNEFEIVAKHKQAKEAAERIGWKLEVEQYAPTTMEYHTRYILHRGEYPNKTFGMLDGVIGFIDGWIDGVRQRSKWF